MEPTWKLREFPVSREDIESMKNSLERLDIFNDAYAVVPSQTTSIHRRLHHCPVCNVILNSCTQTRAHCSGRKHLSRLQDYEKVLPFGTKGDNQQQTSPINCSGIVPLKIHDTSMIEVNSRNIEGVLTPTCPSAYSKRPSPATSTPKTSLTLVVGSNHKAISNHMDTEDGKRTVLQQITHLCSHPMNGTVKSSIMGTSVSKKQSARKVVARCSVCNLEFSGLVVLQSHLSGAKHAKKVKSLEILRELETNSQCIVRDDASKFLKCEVCDTVVSSSQQLQMHLTGVNVSGSGDGPGVGCVPKDFHGNKDLLANCEHNHNRRVKEGSKYMCSTCKVYLNSEIQLQQHMNSKKHKERTTSGKKITPKTLSPKWETESGLRITRFFPKRPSKRHEISHWFGQQQQLQRLNVGPTAIPLRHVYHGSTSGLVGRRTLVSTLPDCYTCHRYVI